MDQLKQPQILPKQTLQKKTQELKHISQSCKENWKAYLILLHYKNFSFCQIWTIILHSLSKFSFPQGFCWSFSKNGTFMPFKSMAIYISKEYVFKSFLLVPGPRNELKRLAFKHLQAWKLCCKKFPWPISNKRIGES